MPLTLAADMKRHRGAGKFIVVTPSVFRMPVITSTQHKTSAPAGPANVGGYRIAAAVQAFGLVLLALLGMTGTLPLWALLCGFGLSLLAGWAVFWRAANAAAIAGRDTGVTAALQQMDQLELTRYRQLVQFANDMFTWHDADGSLHYVSPNVRRLLGYDPAELLGQQMFRLIHPDDLASVHLARADLLAERNPLPITFRIVNRDGVWVWLEMFARLFDLGEGKTRIVGVSRDISLRREAEALVRESERFKALFELARDGLFLIDSRGRIVEANREAAHDLGYHRMHLIGMPLADLLASDAGNDCLLQWHDYFESIQNGRPEQVDAVLIAAGDQHKWVEATFSPISQEGRPMVLLAVRDVTERRQDAIQLQESLGALRVLHNRLYGIIEGSDDLIAALDNGFHIIAFNRAFKQTFEQHLRVPIELGFNLLQFLANDPEQMASAFISLQRALAGEVFTDIETIVVAERVREYEVKYSPIRDEIGGVVGAAYVARDVTGRLHAERELKTALENLQQARHETEQANRQLTEANSELLRQANQDGMTSIANRRYFDEYLAHEWRRAVRQHEPLALIFADVDHFKKYNDHYGHQAGDDCLRQVAQAMAQQLRRPADLLARYGGEEFVVLLPGTSLSGAVFIAESMRVAVEQAGIPHAASDTASYVTLSLGVTSIVPTEAMAEGFLIYGADQALYIAKKSGRNRVHGNPL